METKKEFKTLAEGIEKYLGKQRPTDPAEFNFKTLGEIRRYFEELHPGYKPTVDDYVIAISDAFAIAKKRFERQEKEQQKLFNIGNSKKMFTYDEMYQQAFSVGKNIGEKAGYKFLIDEHNAHQFHLLCLFFTNDPKFEDYGLEIGGKMQQKYDLKKGIWIQSDGRGTGKSQLLNCFKFNKRQSFNYTHTAQMRSEFQKNGYLGLDYYLKEMETYPCSSNYYQSKNGWLYDELFAEGKANHMGTPEVISEYIVNTLYDFSTNHKGNFWKFHCTSNGDGAFIEERNGRNYRSRMSEMYNLIKLDGPDRRR
jgi:hypothetical protein